MHTKVLVTTEINDLHDQDGRLVVTVWTRHVDDTRHEGESWLAMRERTEPLRAAAKAEAAANARLFAAALEMLDTLQEAKHMFANEYPGHPTTERIFAAIEKATGKPA
jgi:hypothetical protein